MKEKSSLGVMKQTLPKGLSLLNFWDETKTTIANERNWGQKATSGSPQGTIKAYSRFIKEIQANLPDTPMCELSAFELLQALYQCRNKKSGEEYDATSYSTRLSALNAVYSYAQDIGYACNDLVFFTSQDIFSSLGHSNQSFRDQKLIAQAMLNARQNRPRSLTAAQQASLVDMILRGIEEDGRYLALAILLYTGVRPSECRGLVWGDISPFTDHPQRHMLSITRQGDNDGNPIDRLKTPNAYRKIGVHVELEQIIERRRLFLKKSGCTDAEISSCNLCCYKNDFSRGCSHVQLATFVVKILRKDLAVSTEVFEMCNLEFVAYEQERVGSSTEDSHICTYLLRHNFWTWLQAATPLSADQKRYYMGHEIPGPRNLDLRPQFNHEDLLWDILLLLDHDIKHLGLHEDHLHSTIDAHTLSVAISNQGYHMLEISPDLLKEGGTLLIQATANEQQDPIMVTPLTGSRNTYQGDDKLKFTANTQPHRHANAVRLPINCDYVNYAARKALRLGKNQFSTDDDTESNPADNDCAETPPDSDLSLKE